MVRRAVALGAGALILILLVVGVKGCLNSRTENALRDYNRNVTGIAKDSDQEVSKRLFELLNASQSSNAIDLAQNVNQIRSDADADVSRARNFDVPDDMKDAQLHLLEALTFRAEGVRVVAEQLKNITGSGAQAAADRIAGAMSEFLASDVVYAQRVVPFVAQGLASHDIKDQQISGSRFLPDIQWLDPAFVRKQLTGKGAGRTSSTPAPGTHGHGLLDVKVNDVTLQPGGVLNRVAGGANPVFAVHFQNQGENDEFDVAIKVSVSGGPRPVVKRIDQTTHGVTAGVVVQVPLGGTPPLNTPVRVTVQIVPVPGEVNVTNNTSTYTVIFSR
jgi:hypothetical protein